jgi:hypothetical protein
MSLLPIIVSPAAGRLPASTVRSMEQLPADNSDFDHGDLSLHLGNL